MNIPNCANCGDCGIIVQQGCVPDYRLEYFELCCSLCPGLRVLGGDMYFDKTIGSSAIGRVWHILATNHFLLGRRLCWQSGVFHRLVRCRLAIMEMNPRLVVNWPILLIRFFLRRPTILWGHAAGARSSGKPHFTMARMMMLTFAKGVLAYTETDASFFSQRYPNKKVVALGNSCVAASDYIPIAENLLTDIIYVGRLVPEKKITLLLKAFLCSTFPGKLHIVGAGPERPVLEEMARKSNKAEKVIFYGHVSDPSKLKEIYNRCLFSASPGYAGLSVIQSMAYGVPVLISRNEPHSPEVEACQDAVTAWFIEESNLAAWSSALNTLIEYKDVWLAKRESIAEFTRSNYTVEAMAENFKVMIDHFD